MKKGQIAEGNVTTVEFPNKGIVMTDEGEPFRDSVFPLQ